MSSRRDADAHGRTPPTPRSTIEGLAWPGVPGRSGQVLLSIISQLEQSQWWPPETLREMQFRQLEPLLRHAAATVPFYRERLAEVGAALTEDAWSQIPVSTRREVQEAFDALHSERVPKAHGKRHEVFTSGSTATPIKVVKTDLAALFRDAMTLREHLWQSRDLGGKLAVIKPTKGDLGAYPKGTLGTAWGRGSASVFATGPAALLSIGTRIPEQAEWLVRQDPDSLVTYPSNLQVLLAHCGKHGVRLPSLRQVQTMSELLYPEVRGLPGAVGRRRGRHV